MNPSLANLAAGIRTASATAERVRAGVARLRRAGDRWGTGATGSIGTVDARLYGLWCEAIDARVAEASEMIGRLDGTADAIVRAATRYAEADAAAASSAAVLHAEAADGRAAALYAEADGASGPAGAEDP